MAEVKIIDIKRYIETLKFAEDIKKANEFRDNIDRLIAIAANQDSNLNIYNDHEKYSFYFEMIRTDGTRMMNGGLIYHGPLPDGSPGGTSSIQLIPSVGWSIHT